MKQLLIFAVGLGLGSAGTYFVAKKHFDRYLDEEIEAMKEYYKERIIQLAKSDSPSFQASENVGVVSEEVQETEEPNYEGIIEKLNYGSYSNKEDTVSKKAESKKEKGPYVIEPNDFVEDSQYDKITLTYFSEDEVFMTVDEVCIPEGMLLIGKDNLVHIGEIEEDVVYIRNENLGADYEVILEERSYCDSEYAAGNDEDY